jgi:hypothetical protein
LRTRQLKMSVMFLTGELIYCLPVASSYETGPWISLTIN